MSCDGLYAPPPAEFRRVSDGRAVGLVDGAGLDGVETQEPAVKARITSPIARGRLQAGKLGGASQRSLQACASSLAFRSSFMSNDIVQVGPLFRGRTTTKDAKCQEETFRRKEDSTR